MISRYTFYLAQSYRDAGDNANALRTYLKRAGQGFWDQEIFVSLLCAGRLMETLGYSDAEILGPTSRPLTPVRAAPSRCMRSRDIAG